MKKNKKIPGTFHTKLSIDGKLIGRDSIEEETAHKSVI
jgi:hypothetical protein